MQFGHKHLGWLLPSLLMLGACASREMRIESALADAGVPRSMATCMAPRLAEDLSNDQLKRLAEAAKATQTRPADREDALPALYTRLDPLTIATVGRISIGCLLF